MSSIETRPSVPPYSSMTSAIWVREPCILTRRSRACIDGGTKRTGRVHVGIGHAGVEGSPGPSCRSTPPAEDRPSSPPAHRRNRGCGSCLSGRRGCRRGRAGANDRQLGTRARTSPRVMAEPTAMISARGTMMSSTRISWRPRTLRSIARSCCEKTASAPVSSNASSMSSRNDTAPSPNTDRNRSRRLGGAARRSERTSGRVGSSRSLSFMVDQRRNARSPRQWVRHRGWRGRADAGHGSRAPPWRRPPCRPRGRGRPSEGPRERSDG